MLFWAFMVVVVVAIVLVVVGRSGNDPESVMARLPVRERQRLALLHPLIHQLTPPSCRFHTPARS